jgi:hypothetical protein
MFERVIASVLSRYLGNFIEVAGIERDLRVSVLSGSLSLEGLSLKRGCLAFLGLPLVVKCGSVAKLELEIPWRRLSS